MHYKLWLHLHGCIPLCGWRV